MSKSANGKFPDLTVDKRVKILYKAPIDKISYPQANSTN